MENYAKLSIKPSTKKLVMNECVKEFLEENPEFEGIRITEEFIIKRIAEHYLK